MTDQNKDGLKVFRMLVNGDPETGMQPSDMIEVSAFTTSNQSETNCTFFQTENSSVINGVWECAPCVEEIESYPVHEMMTVISGSVTMTNDDGSSDTFISGDTFFIAKGTKCTWEVTETLRKFYMIAE